MKQDIELTLTEGVRVAAKPERPGLKAELGLDANLLIEQFRAGMLYDRRIVHNLITNAGLAPASGLLNGVVTNFYEHIAVGIGVVAANVSDTTLGTEITDSGLARVAGTTSQQTNAQTDDTARVTTAFTVTGTKAVTEAGLLDSISTGILLCRQTFAALNVVNGDTLTITWDITVS